MCNNEPQNRQMKRNLFIGLSLMLLLSSLGHVFAAAFCPHMQDHECCLRKTASHMPKSSSGKQDIAMHSMAMDGMGMRDMNMDHMVMDDIKTQSAPSTAIGDGLANKFELPADSCAHCMGHSGLPNAPVSFVPVQGQSRKDVGSAPLPVSQFLLRSAMTLMQSRPPREHSPPRMRGPRHILISVFLI